MGDVAVGRGASCAAGADEPSHVLTAMGLSHELARSTLRFGLGRFTTSDDVDRACRYLAECVHKLNQ